MNADTWRDRRKKAAWRRRRAIMNNDGDDATGSQIPDGVEPTREAFWAQRCTGLEGSHADAIFYCTGGNFSYHSYDSRVAELSTHSDGLWSKRNLTQHWIDLGRDSLGMIVDFCRLHGKEVFWSLRMNDIHDNWYPAMMPRFKREHPELLLFQPDDVGRTRTSPDWPEPHMLATAVDYGHAEVRDRQFAIIEDVCRGYDLDGIELDFMRNPFFFRPTFEGRPCQAQHVEIMTAFVRRVRDLTEEVGRQRNRPLLVACRLPSRVDCCRKIALDIKGWLDDDLIDVLVSCIEFDPFTGPLGELVELGHRHEAPVYACLADSFSFQGIPDRLPGWAAAATNAWNAGVDGIYTFNNFTPTLPMWHVVGDPAALAKMDKVYAVDNLAGRLRTWEPAYSTRGRLPADLPLREPISIELPVGDDVAARARDGEIEQLTLRIFIERMTYADEIELRLNGRLLEPEVVYATEGISPVAVSKFLLHVDPDAQSMKQGVNHFTAHLKHRSESAPGTPTLTGLELLLKYKR